MLCCVVPTQVGRHVLQHFRTRYLTAALDAWRFWYQRKTYLAAVFAQLQGKGHKQVSGGSSFCYLPHLPAHVVCSWHVQSLRSTFQLLAEQVLCVWCCTDLQIMQLVWSAWRSFVPQVQVKRQAKGRAAAHWQRRELIRSFAWWHDYAAVMKVRRQQLADALLRWDMRRMWLALEGWRALVRHQQHRQERVAEGSSRRRRLVLATALRGWQEETQLQQYRRHVVTILGHKVNNGLLLKALNCWRCVLRLCLCLCLTCLL